MAEQRGKIFILAQDTRAGDLASTELDAEHRRVLEAAFADKLGIDKAQSGTESTCDDELPCGTVSGTETPSDMTTDHETDSCTVTTVDDMDSDNIA